MSRKTQTRLFSFYIFVDLFERLKKIAFKQDRSISGLINQAVREFLEKKNEENLS